jgi:hypothetical protein
LEAAKTLEWEEFHIRVSRQCFRGTKGLRRVVARRAGFTNVNEWLLPLPLLLFLFTSRTAAFAGSLFSRLGSLLGSLGLLPHHGLQFLDALLQLLYFRVFVRRLLG